MTIKSIRTGWNGISALAGNDQWFGDFESIASATVGEDGASTISFSSIPSIYTHLQIRGLVKPVSTGWINIQFNNNTTSGNYQRHFVYGDGASALSGWSGSTSIGGTSIGYANSANNFSGIVCDILDYANTNKATTTKSLTGFDNNGSGLSMLLSGAFFPTTAVSSIQIFSEPGNMVRYSHFALYGIRG